MLESPKTIFRPKANVELLHARENSGADDLKVYKARYRSTAYASGTSDQHLLVINAGSKTSASCRVGMFELNHKCETGNVTLIPAYMDWSASIADSPEILLVSIPTALTATAAARMCFSSAQLQPRLRGQDNILLSIVEDIAMEGGLRSGGEWQDIVDELADHIVRTCATRYYSKTRGVLSPEALARMNQHLTANFSVPPSLDELADLLKVSRSHFPRLFRRTTGISPLQYVIRLRLRYARKLICAGMPIAEASLEAGFSHQSHLTNWMRRLRGATPGRLNF